MKRTIAWLFLFGSMTLLFPAQVSNPAQLKKAEQFYRKGVAAAKAGKLDAATRLFREALAAYDRMPGVYVELGNLDAFQRRYPQALENYLRAKELYLQIARDREMERAKQAWADQERQLSEQLQSQSTTELEEHEDPTKNVYQPLEAKMKKKDVSRMVEPAEEGVPARLHLLLGVTRIQLGQYDQAVADLEEGVRCEPESGELHFQMAVACFHRQEYARSATEARLAEKYGYKVPPEYIKALEEQGRIKW